MPQRHVHEVEAGGSAAAKATLHCLTGCAIGEVSGLILGTAAGLGAGETLALAVLLAFVFGYTLSTLPLLRAGLTFVGALRIVLVADTLSIVTMELVDNLVMAVVPGAMDASLVDPLFWVSMLAALAAAFIVALPVNRYQLARGRGHALTHEYHHHAPQPSGFRAWVPDPGAGALAAGITAFILGGLVAASAHELGRTPPDEGPHDQPAARGLGSLH